MKRNLGLLVVGAIVAGTTLLGFAEGTSAQVAETIDLAAAPLGDFTELSLGEYQLTWVGYGDEETVVNYGGTNVLEDSDEENLSGAEVVITRVDGGSFSLLSADLAATGPVGDFGVAIAIGSSTYGEYSGSSISSSFETVSPTGTTDVASVDLNIVDFDSGYAVTNLVVQAVPEPRSLALTGFGVLGLIVATARARYVKTRAPSC